MLEKIGRLAERAATDVSRRQFLAWAGRGAMTAAAAVGGILALPAQAQATTACGANSQTACVGKSVGQWCPAGTRSGVCVRATSGGCACQAQTPPRGRDRPRGRRGYRDGATTGQ
jgi:hypothetical protein